LATVLALDPGKSIEKIAAIQIPLYNLSNMGAEETESSFKTIVINMFQGLKVVFNAAIVGGLFGISGSIYGGRHRHMPGDCIFFAI
jgi:hypothetical protein